MHVELTRCLNCGVPYNIHGTCCGWHNSAGSVVIKKPQDAGAINSSFVVEISNVSSHENSFYQQEFEKLKDEWRDQKLTLLRQHQVIEDLQRKLGFYRNAVRQGQDITIAITNDVPEVWEPNVNYGNPDKPQR